MPNIVVNIPSGSYPGASRLLLAQEITDAAAAAEQIPPDARKRAMCSVLIDEMAPGAWTCGGADISARVLLCFAVVHVPAGVVDAVSGSEYVRLMHAAFVAAMPSDDKRQLATSIILNAVPDGTWGVSGKLWTLPDFARASGYVHLQHLVSA